MGSVFSVASGQQTGNTGSGAAGVGFQANSADIINATTKDQADAQYDSANQAIQQQADFLRAVQAQNGLGNQTNVYNQLGQVAQGQGPNPAQAQLAQSTGANTANQAALMAGQRGSSQNVGLLARQAAQQGGANQQQAAGQAATLQAQQSLNALSAQGQMATNMVNNQSNATAALTGATQGEQGQVLGAIQGQNNANVGITSNQNTANAGLANTVAGAQQSFLGSIAGGIGSAFSMAEGGQIPTGAAKRPMFATGGDVGTTPLQSAPQSRIGKFFQGVKDSGPQASQQTPAQQGASQTGSALGSFGAKGAKAAYNYFNTPSATPTGADMASKLNPAGSSRPLEPMEDSQGPQIQEPGGLQTVDAEGNFASAPESAATDADVGYTEAGQAGEAGEGAEAAEAGEASEIGEGAEAAELADVGEAAEVVALSGGGKVPALLSPGERYLPPKAVAKVAKGADPMKEGKKVPGTPKVKGAKNSYANDTVKASLDEGGIVLPRSVTQHKNPEWAAHAFVRGIMAKNRQGLKK